MGKKEIRDETQGFVRAGDGAGTVIGGVGVAFPVSTGDGTGTDDGTGTGDGILGVNNDNGSSGSVQNMV